MRNWEDARRAKVAELEQKAAPILTEIERTKRELALGGQLRRLQEGDVAPPFNDPHAPPINGKPDPPVADVVAHILAQAGTPFT